MIERVRRIIDGVSFGRGLALGALVGAAIAGSSLWSRVREARERQESAKAGTSDR